MKRCLAMLCAFLILMSFFAYASGEPLPQDTLIEDNNIDLLAVDHRLYELGYRNAECNGELDDVTINALIKFQTVNGLEPSGKPDEQTVSLLMSEKAVSQIEYLSQKAYEYSNAPPLKNGSYGDAVLKLQRALQKLGYFSGKCDGVYGDATAAAVSRFQLVNGLAETGIADGSTFLRLYEGEALSWDEFLAENHASAGDSGENVRLIQRYLRNLGYFSGECTGKYGEGTQNAVRNYQIDHDLEASGDVDDATARLLFAESVSGDDALSRGSTDESAYALCGRLIELGYPAHTNFDMQTELALMQCQYINGYAASGSADENFMQFISGENVRTMQEYEYPAFSVDEDGGTRLARKANSALGQLSQFDENRYFAEYILLCCGYPPVNLESAAFVELDTDAKSGSILRMVIDDREIYGIAAMDGAVIYQGDEGYIVIGYPDMLEADRVYIVDWEAQDAA